jgi:hypothetical protein
MKAYVLLSLVAFCGSATAFWGQLAAGDIMQSEGGEYQFIYLTDYNTGSKYETELHDGFSGCVSSKCTAG